MKWLYLSIDLGCIFFPLVFSFYRKTYFFKEWKWYIPANVLVLIFFILWDEKFTQLGVWGFNEKYVSGLYISHLPIEEILFFVCIPYACVFTYFNVRQYVPLENYEKFSRIFMGILATILAFIGFLHLDKYYTSFTFLGLSACIILILLFEKKKYIASFLVGFLLIIVPFFLSNGLLTGSWIPEEVVWYNDAENLGIRMLTIPVEDLFYGMLLILLNVVLYENVKCVFFTFSSKTCGQT